jgi:hypothetical protein
MQFAQHRLQDDHEDAVVWSAEGTWIRLNVIESLTTIPVDVHDWEDVASRGSVHDILKFLESPTCNVNDIRLEALVPRLSRGDAKAYKAIMDVLRNKLLVFDRELAKLAFVHADVQGIRDWLAHDRRFLLTLGPGLATCPLLGGGKGTSAGLATMPLPGAMLGVREYHELCDFVRARVHGSGPWQQQQQPQQQSGHYQSGGNSHNTMSRSLAELHRMEQWYHRYVADLCLLPKGTVATHTGIKLRLALFWVALGRTAEALAAVAQIRQQQQQQIGSSVGVAIPEAMQLDFLDAYLDFHREYAAASTTTTMHGTQNRDGTRTNAERFAVARRVAREWAAKEGCAPVWKARFVALKEELRRLDELDSNSSSSSDKVSESSAAVATTSSVGNAFLADRQSALVVEAIHSSGTTAGRTVLRVQAGENDVSQGRTLVRFEVFVVDMELQFAHSPLETTYLWMRGDGGGSATSMQNRSSSSAEAHFQSDPTGLSGSPTSVEESATDARQVTAKRAMMLRAVTLGMAPALVLEREVCARVPQVVVDLPANLQRKCLVVSATLCAPTDGTGHRVPQLMASYAPRAMLVSLDRATGIVNVADAASGRPIPAAYVKCFRQLWNVKSLKAMPVEFHRDGYTNVLGEVGLLKGLGGGGGGGGVDSGGNSSSRKDKTKAKTYNYMVLVVDPRTGQHHVGACELVLETL